MAINNNYFTQIQGIIQRLQKNKFFKFGIPFFILVCGTPFALQEFTSLRYEFRNPTELTREELAKEGIIKKKPEEVSLEKAYEKLKEIDLDNWKNIRGPRAWEDNTEYDEMVRKNKEERRKKNEAAEVAKSATTIST